MVQEGFSNRQEILKISNMQGVVQCTGFRVVFCFVAYTCAYLYTLPPAPCAPSRHNRISSAGCNAHGRGRHCCKFRDRAVTKKLGRLSARLITFLHSLLRSTSCFARVLQEGVPLFNLHLERRQSCIHTPMDGKQMRVMDAGYLLQQPQGTTSCDLSTRLN
jgi:hypothetical protein